MNPLHAYTSQISSHAPYPFRWFVYYFFLYEVIEFFTQCAAFNLFSVAGVAPKGFLYFYATVIAVNATAPFLLTRRSHFMRVRLLHIIDVTSKLVFSVSATCLLFYRLAEYLERTTNRQAILT
jgi:hypothetical protein